MVFRCVGEHFGLPPVLDDDQAERFPGLVHAVQRLGNGAIGVGLPGGCGDSGNGLLCGCIQPPADGEGLAGVFAVIDDVGLIAVPTVPGLGISVLSQRFSPKPPINSPNGTSPAFAVSSSSVA